MRSIWYETVQLPDFPSLKQDVVTDVPVIGSGITSLLCAYILREAGFDCILAEADTIMSGVSGLTTAKLTSQHSLICGKLQTLWGKETAHLYCQANQAALEEFARLCGRISCAFERQNAYVFSRHSVRPLETEYSVLKQIGANASLEPQSNPPFPTAGGLRFPNQAQFHPLKFASVCAESLAIYAHTPVTALYGTVAVTPEGKIRADR